MRSILRIAACTPLLAGWAASVVIGSAKLWEYESTAGTPARAPSTLPSNIASVKDQPTLYICLHPQCPCSRAALEELARLMTACNGKLTATVLMVRPASEPEGWEHTDLWTSAARIPGVNVLVDIDGQQSLRFGADTSGQTLLYSAKGQLLFSGGITESRGHNGDNDGESAVIGLVLRGVPEHGSLPIRTPVYGCSLFDQPQDSASKEFTPWLK